MIDFYLWLFIAICGGLLAWGLLEPSRIYQYPFFMGGIFSSFVLPQAFALIKNPDPLRSDGIERVLVMCCLCAAMCFVGYQLKPNLKFLEKIDIPIDEKKLLQVGLVAALVTSYLQFFSGFKIEISSETGGMTGFGTIIYFFLQANYISTAILMFHTVKFPTARNIVTILFCSLPVIINLLIGRRQNMATFIFIIILSLFFVRRYITPRIIAIGVIAASTILIPVIGAYRNSGIFTLFTLSPDDYIKSFNETVLSGGVLELRNAAIIMDASEYRGQYGYGSSYWNFLVFRFVPAQLLGKDFKSSLLINQIDLKNFTGSFGYSIPLGSTNTGMGDSFLEFNYLGCIFFGLQAYFFKHLWISSTVQKSVPSRLLYIGLVSPALISVTHGTVNFLPDLIYQIIFLGSGIFYARVKKQAPESLEEVNKSNKIGESKS